MSHKKNKCLYFPKLYLRHLLFLFFVILSCIKKGVQIYFENNQKIAIEFLKLYMYDVGDFLTIIPLIIMKKRMNNKKMGERLNSTASNNSLKYIYTNQIENKNNCSLIRNIFIFALVDFIAQISPVIYYVVKEDQRLVVKQANLISTLIFNIIFVILFSVLILHTNFYRHHLFAFSIDLVFLIILTTFELTNLFKDAEENIGMSIIYILIKILGSILHSLENVLAKYMFLYNFLSTFALLVNKSIYHFIYLIIFSFPFIFKKIEIKEGESGNIFSMIGEIFDDKKYYFIVIGYTIISFLYNNISNKIIDVFSPNHYANAKVLENIGIFVMDLIINGIDSSTNLVLRIITFVLLILSACIFNEFLIINICGLSKNTKLFLDYEAKNEIKKEKLNEENIELEDSNTTDF